MPLVDPPTCDLLLFVTTVSEEGALKKVVRARGIRWIEQESELGRFWDLGQLGSRHVVAVRQEQMGAIGPAGSARTGWHYLQASKASALICLGFAFGLDEQQQSVGTVLVSETLFPYDFRTVIPRSPVLAGGAPWVDSYDGCTVFPANPELLRVLAAHQPLGFEVQFGCMLSGQARLSSTAFRDELLRACQPVVTGSIIGGEMEGVGFLAHAPADAPKWILAKGIADFAGDGRDSAGFGARRKKACQNAATFVVEALEAS
jgi:nucleoside phosphorylase